MYPDSVVFGGSDSPASGAASLRIALEDLMAHSQVIGCCVQHVNTGCVAAAWGMAPV